MAEMAKSEEAVRPWWRRREPVERIGYILSAVWMAGIVLVTDGDTGHHLFDFIFTVPLAGWIIGLAIAALLRRRERKRNR